MQGTTQTFVERPASSQSQALAVHDQQPPKPDLSAGVICWPGQNQMDICDSETALSFGNDDEDAVTVCSGSITSNDRPQENVSPQNRSGMSSSGSDKKLVALKKALSEYVKDYPRDFIDPIAFAQRSVDERRRKAAKEGRITRPLNSYMLYRKAYQQVARAVSQKDQQQCTSQTVGYSWSNLESKATKSNFRVWAKMDHDMHHEAFPAYKYTPTPGKAPKGPSMSKKSSRKTRYEFSPQPGNRDAASPTGSSALTPKSMEGIYQDSPCGHNIDWWSTGYHDLENSFPKSGSDHEDFVSYPLPGSGHWETKLSSKLDEQPPNMSKHFLQLAPKQVDSLSMEHCIDPSLFSNPGDTNYQLHSQYLDWQSRDLALSQGQIPFMPVTATNHHQIMSYQADGVWPAEQADQGVYFGWHTVDEGNGL